jgi:hypothetical protein
MHWLVLTAVGIVVLGVIIYKVIKPRNRARRYDVDSVSEYWIAQQRRRSEDETR